MWIRATGEGVGDTVFMTGLAYHIKSQRPKEFVGIACCHHALFDNNPCVDQLAGWCEAPETPVVFYELHDQKNIKEHNLQFMCRKLGIVPPPWHEVRQYLFLTQAECDIVEPAKYVTISALTSDWTPNKNWFGFEKLVQLIKENSDLLVYQLGGPKEEALPGVDKFIKESLRVAAAYLKGALRHICCVTGTMHMASGVGTKSIVIYGGRERARITGYYNNINIETEPPQGCSPCWLVEPCPHGTHRHRDGKFLKPCLDLMITPEQVWEQVQTSLGCELSASHASGRYPLPLQGSHHR